jgi:hypothetical protein
MTYADHQINQARLLNTAPRPGYTVTVFHVEQHRDVLFVSREYVPDHAPSLVYREGYAVGPRGGLEIIHKSFG